MSVLRHALTVADVVVLGYFLLINTGYLALIGLACADLVRHRRRLPFSGTAETYRNPLTEPITVVMPAYNESAGIVAAVEAVGALRYPAYEVLVVDDGSTDGTYERLREAFDLVEVPRVVPAEVPYRGRVRGVYRPRPGTGGLVVVRKENGGKADALNVGINLASHPLVCMVDADSILDPDALLSVAKPFADDPLRVVASGGVVRVANGCTVLAGRVVDVRMPRSWLARVQVVEYLRAFLLGRTGWSRLGGLVIISGAFGLFRRDLLVEAGGMAQDCIGEDAELVVRLHRRQRERDRDYRVVFVAEPVSWSEAPDGVRALARQRRRWQRGMTEILIRHRRMLGNPRYGRIGLFTLPYYLLFELLAPVVELSALVLVPVGLLLDAVDPAFAWRFLLVAYAYGCLISLVALAVEEVSFHRFGRWRDMLVLVIVAALENVGFRQLTGVWRLQGSWAALRGHAREWGAMPRRGFATVGPADRQAH